MSEQPHAAHGDDHGDHGHGHGSPFTQHHYDDAQHQFDSGKLGIWLFLAQEVLFFSALFVAYILYRHHHPEIWAYAHKYLDTKMGAINTAVLIFSSLTAAWAVRAAQLRQQKLLIACLAATLLCACGFLVIKYQEYTHKIHEHILFGTRFDPCISPSENPLATRLNECPGTKTTIEHRIEADMFYHPSTVVTGGCFPNVAIDTDPHSAGVQANCKVFAVTGKKTKGADGKDAFAETKREPIIKQCHDPLNEALAKLAGHGGDEIETVSHAEGHETKHVACWKPAEQPAVCTPGWYYGWVCTGAKCDKPSGSEGPFKLDEECKAKRNPKAASLGADGTVSECAYGGASAILVDWEDHEVRHSPELNHEGTMIEAQCTAPAAYAGLDFTKEHGDAPIELSKRTTSASGHLLDHHAIHELEKEVRYAGPPPEHTSMFFTIYFAMTGLHGIHVLVGVFVFIWLLIRAVKGHFTPDYFGPVDFAALYWHIVDLIWIFLFPLMYLIH